MEDALELAQLSQPDPFAGPPDPSCSPSARAPRPRPLRSRGRRVDARRGACGGPSSPRRAALDHDPRITNTEGATFTRVSGGTALVTSGGFRGAAAAPTRRSWSARWSTTRAARSAAATTGPRAATSSELETDEAVGDEAARRTLRKLGARKVETQEVAGRLRSRRGALDPRPARRLRQRRLRLAQVELSRSIASSTQIASELVTVVDDPLIPRGPGSRPYDGEGLLSRRNVIVEKGRAQELPARQLQRQKLNQPQHRQRLARQLGRRGHLEQQLPPPARQPDARGDPASSHRGASRHRHDGLRLQRGDRRLQPRRRRASGSRTASCAFPVSEVTISLNLDELLKRIDAVGNDLDLRTSVASPTLRVSSMTLAGK